jgi:hypothetical protein
MIALNVIGPYQIILFSVIYFLLIIYSLYLILKNETNLFAFAWLLFVIFIPFFGSIIYISKYYLNKNSAHKIV